MGVHAVGHLGTAVITREGDDRYVVASDQAGLGVDALRTNDGSNTRMIVWPKGVDRVTDSESCAVWVDHGGPIVQQGTVFRVTRSGTRVRAVTVTQNILYGAAGAFNVHTWDTARSGQPYRMAGQIDLSDTFFSDIRRPRPWTLCARVIGDRVEMKIWDTDDQAEPAWGDRRHGGAVMLPSGWRQAGQTGWYAGHLGPGEHADFAQLSTWTYDPRKDTATSRAEAGPTASIGALRIAAR